MIIESEDEARAYCGERLDRRGTERLERYVDLLREENGRQNLVAARTLSEIWRRHVADGLQLTDHVPRGTGAWLDLGSGAGIPGIVVAVAHPDRSIVLVESRKLRADWLEGLAEQLDLANVRVHSQRVERTEAFPAAVISARAFAPLAKLLRLSVRFSTPDTVWVLPKGRSAGQELSEQPSIVQRMFHVEPSVTDAEAGILVGQGVPELR